MPSLTLLRHAYRWTFSARHVTAAGAAALTLTVLPATASAAASRTGVPAHPVARHGALPQDETTASFDDLRSGWDPGEPSLSPSAVAGGTFGQVFSTAVNGQVYAQPLVIGNTVVVATETDWVYGLNASTGAIEWSDHLGTPQPMTACKDIMPDIGSTSAPVYDPATNTVYLTAVITEATTQYRLVGLNPATGAVTFKQRITGHPTNDPNINFTPTRQVQRAGLLLMNGWVYASFGSHCDFRPYSGYIAGWDVATGQTTLWTDEDTLTNHQAGIWQGGDGMMSDGSGRIFVTSGNGVSPAPGPGATPPGQLAESTIRLAPQADGSLKAEDFFSPADAPKLDAGDTDFGSGGPVGLPVGTVADPDILVQGGKDGRVFLLNRDSLGGREQGSGGTDNVLFQAGPYGGQWGHPAVFEASTSPLAANSTGLDDYLYYLGKNDFLRALQLGTNASGAPTLTNAANSTYTLGYTSGAPVVTSNGTDATTALVWVVHSSGYTGTGSFLEAFDALPQPRAGGGVKLHQVWSSPIGTAAAFTIPAVSNGMVYVGTKDGHVFGFGVKQAAALRTSGTASFNSTNVGGHTTKDVTVTAVKTVTVTGAAVTTAPTSTAGSPYTLGTVTETTASGHRSAVTFPVTLSKGDELHAPVTFTPTVPGGVAGAVSFTASSSSPTDASLTGTAVANGLYATATSLGFALVLNDGANVSPVPVGVTVPQVTNIVNGGTTDQTITKVTVPGGVYSTTGIPKLGTVLKPGQSFVVRIVYAPKKVQVLPSSITIAGSSGPPVTVSLNGSSEKALSKFTAPTSVDFGSVPLGHTVTRTIHITNAGNQPSLVRKTSVSAPFRNPVKPADGLPVNGGDDLTIPVTFTPTGTGAFTGSYTFIWTDRFGTHTITVPVSGTGS